MWKTKRFERILVKIIKNKCKNTEDISGNDRVDNLCLWFHTGCIQSRDYPHSRLFGYSVNKMNLYWGIKTFSKLNFMYIGIFAMFLVFGDFFPVLKLHSPHIFYSSPRMYINNIVCVNKIMPCFYVGIYINGSCLLFVFSNLKAFFFSLYSLVQCRCFFIWYNGNQNHMKHLL